MKRTQLFPGRPMTLHLHVGRFVALSATATQVAEEKSGAGHLSVTLGCDNG
jgi:hypothetical protein